MPEVDSLAEFFWFSFIYLVGFIIAGLAIVSLYRNSLKDHFLDARKHSSTFMETQIRNYARRSIPKVGYIVLTVLFGILFTIFLYYQFGSLYITHYLVPMALGVSTCLFVYVIVIQSRLRLLLKFLFWRNQERSKPSLLSAVAKDRMFGRLTSGLVIVCISIIFVLFFDHSFLNIFGALFLLFIGSISIIDGMAIYYLKKHKLYGQGAIDVRELAEFLIKNQSGSDPGGRGRHLVRLYDDDEAEQTSVADNALGQPVGR